MQRGPRGSRLKSKVPNIEEIDKAFEDPLLNSDSLYHEDLLSVGHGRYVAALEKVVAKEQAQTTKVCFQHRRHCAVR